MKHIFKYISACALAVILCGVCACRNEKPPEDVVARVNGEEIRLHELRNAMDIRMGALGLSFPQTVEETRKNYIDALNYMIAQILIRQELEKKNIKVDEKAYKQALEAVVQDYGQENFKAALDEAFIREEDFEKLLRDQTNMEVFKSSVLFPGIKITADEIKKYYIDHRSAFERPESYHVCLASSPDKEAIVDWIANANKGIIVENEFARCLWISSESAVDLKRTTLKSMKTDVCSPPERAGNDWRTAILLEKRPSAIDTLPESFALIESVLLDMKKYDAFNSWLDEKIKSSSIEITPSLNESLSIVAGEIGKDD